jgi:hypothetical protein
MIKVRILAKPEIKVRIAFIDAPEKGQAFDQRGKQAMSELVFGKDVKWYGLVVGSGSPLGDDHLVYRVSASRVCANLILLSNSKVPSRPVTD